jgi:hypothetical protein
MSVRGVEGNEEAGIGVETQGSVSVAFFSHEISARNVQDAGAKHFLEPSKKIRAMMQKGHLGTYRQEPGDDAFSLGDLDLDTLPKQVFHAGKVVAKIANAGLFHM